MNIIDLLDKRGPMLSSSIKVALISTGMSDDAARQVISRTRKNVKRLGGNLFPKRTSFIYLEKHINTSIFFENLVNALKETNSAHYSAIASLGAWGGKIALNKFKVLSGAPMMRKKHKNFSLLVLELINSGLASRYIEDNIEIIELNNKVPPHLFNLDSINTLNTLEELIFAAMKNWLKFNSLGSFNLVKRLGEFNSYHWDITAPSYLFPLYTKKEQVKNPGFLVVDILPQFEIQKDQIKYFIKKFEASKKQYKSGKFLPILIGNSFLPDAFELGKQTGFLITTPGNLFGEHVSDLLSDLKNTLENMSAAATKKSEEEILKMIRSVAKLEGKSNNIRGHLFELVSGHIISKMYSVYIEIGKKIFCSDGDQAEIDVFGLEGKKSIRIYECKGYNPNQTIDLSYIKNWMKKIAIIRKWLNNNNEFRNRMQYFEFWTTSSFEQDAIEYLNEIKKDVKKFTIEYKDSNNLIELVKELKLNSIYEILRVHYTAEEN